MDVFPVSTLTEVVEHLNSINLIQKFSVEIDQFFQNNYSQIEDFADVKGQYNVKRAMEISASRRS